MIVYLVPQVELMALLPFMFCSLQRDAVKRLAISLALSVFILGALQPVAGQAIPYVVPGTITTANASGTTCFDTHACGDNGPLSQAGFVQIDQMIFDGSGNLYLVDATDARVRKVTKGSGPITEGIVTPVTGQPQTLCPSPTALCGDGGPASDSSALLNDPTGIALNAAGDLFISDFGDNRVRRVDHQTGIITTFAGNGGDGFLNPSNIDGMVATQVGIQPWAIAVAPDGTVYIVDGQASSIIRAIDPNTQRIRTVGVTTTGCMNYIQKLSFAPNGDLYFAVQFPDAKICKIEKSTGITSIVAGGGSQLSSGTVQRAQDSELSDPLAVLALPSGDVLFADSQIFRIEMKTGLIYPIAGCSFQVTCGKDVTSAANVRMVPRNFAMDQQGNIFYPPDGTQGTINEILNTPATISFADTALNTRSSDSPQTAYLMNLGTQPLMLAAGTPGMPATFNPLLTTATAGAADSFTLDNNGTLADGLTEACSSPSATPSPLASGSTCGFGLGFQPTATGAITGSLTLRYTSSVLPDQQQVIPLSGKTISGPPASATVAVQSVPYGTASVTLTASVTYSGGTPPSGTATFVVNGGATVAATCAGSASPLVCTAAYNPSMLTVGSYPITFHLSANGTDLAIDANNTLSITKANATVTLGSLSATYDGNPHAVTVFTAPSGLGLSITYNGVTAVPSAVGTYTVVATVTDPNYTGSATGTLVISGLVTPTITFAIPPHVFGDANFNIAATSNSPGALTYRIVSGPAMITSTIVHLNGAGTVMVEASQAPSGAYSAATKIAAFSVTKATPTILWPIPAAVAYAAIIGPAQLNASATGVAGVSLTGNFTYTPPIGTAAVQTPSETLHTIFTPTDTTNYNTSTASVSLAVAPAVTSQDFTFTVLSSPSSDLHVGGTATYQLRVSPPSGQTFSSDVHMSYSSASLPFYGTGQFSAVTVNAGSGPTDLTFRVVTTKLAFRERLTHGPAEIVAAMLMPLCLLRRRKALRGMALVIFAATMLAASTALSGCGSGYLASRIPITITAESGGIKHSIIVQANILQTAQ